MQYPSNSSIGNGTFELRYGTAKSSTMDKRQNTRVQPERDISDTASWATVNRDIAYMGDQAKRNINIVKFGSYVLLVIFAIVVIGILAVIVLVMYGTMASIVAYFVHYKKAVLVTVKDKNTYVYPGSVDYLIINETNKEQVQVSKDVYDQVKLGETVLIDCDSTSIPGISGVYDCDKIKNVVSMSNFDKTSS
jgi:hypothetical protein